MARAAKSIHHLRSQVFSFTQPHQLELAGAFDRDSVPRCDPYVARFTEPDSNLFSVRTLGVNRESQRSGKAVMQQTAPGIAALHYQISIFLAFIPHLSATLRGVDRSANSSAMSGKCPRTFFGLGDLAGKAGNKK